MKAQINIKRKQFCEACGECCRYFYIPCPWEITPDLKEWLEARGVEIHEIEGGPQIKVPLVCPHLDGNLCKIHDHKPAHCRRWTCGLTKYKTIWIGE